MILAAAALVAHIFTWPQAPGQLGIAVKNNGEEHLIYLMRPGGCAGGLHLLTTGRYGEWNKAEDFLIYKSHLCGR